MKLRIALVALVLFFLFSGSVHAQSASQASQAAKIGSPPANASALELENTADQLRTQKDYEHAIEYYRAAIRLDPKNAVLFNKCGIAELQLNYSWDAKKDFSRALKLNPAYAEARNNLGVAYYTEHNYKRAIREYEKAIRLREDFASFHANLGTALFARHKIDDAMQSYARALQLDPDVLVRTSQGGLAARVSSPEDLAHYNYILAKLYAKQGDIDRSIECLRHAQEQRYSRIGDVYRDPEFAKVRTDPRFSGLTIEEGK